MFVVANMITIFVSIVSVVSVDQTKKVRNNLNNGWSCPKFDKVLDFKKYLKIAAFLHAYYRGKRERRMGLSWYKSAEKISKNNLVHPTNN